jgi:hypothetical protein
MTLVDVPVRVWQRSSSQVTSRTWLTWFSMVNCRRTMPTSLGWAHLVEVEVRDRVAGLDLDSRAAHAMSPQQADSFPDVRGREMFARSRRCAERQMVRDAMDVPRAAPLSSGGGNGWRSSQRENDTD